jgi:DNA-binding Xre family transcriptional regulator
MISPSTIDPLQLPSVGLTDKKQLPQIPCIYFAIDIYDQIQYIGRSINPRQRWQNHHRQAQLIGCRIAYMECDVALLDEVETALIEWFSPQLNGMRSPVADLGAVVNCKLSALMQAMGVDQKTVAEGTGLSPTTVGKLCRNHFDRIDNHTAIQLCKYFGLKTLDDLIEIVWKEDAAAADQYKH